MDTEKALDPSPMRVNGVGFSPAGSSNAAHQSGSGMHAAGEAGTPRVEWDSPGVSPLQPQQHQHGTRTSSRDMQYSTNNSVATPPGPSAALPGAAGGRAAPQTKRTLVESAVRHADQALPHMAICHCPARW